MTTTIENNFTEVEIKEPMRLTTHELYSRAYMGDDVFINGKKYDWQTLRTIPEVSYSVNRITSNGAVNQIFAL